MTSASDGWRLAILVTSVPGGHTPEHGGEVLFAVRGLAGLVPYRPGPDERMVLGAAYMVRVSVADGRRVTEAILQGDGHAP